MNANSLRLSIILSLLFVSFLPSAHAADKLRRWFMQMGVSSLLIPKAPTPASTVPAIAAETTTIPVKSLLNYRSDTLVTLLRKQILNWQVSSELALKPDQLDIFEDWLKQNTPASKQAKIYYQDLAQAIEQYNDYEKLILRHQDFLFSGNGGELIFSKDEDYLAKSKVLAKNISVTRKHVLNLVTEEPWASWKWEKVFSARLSEAELELAHEFNVPVTEVYQTFEQMLSFALSYPEVGSNHNLITSLASTDFLHHPVPLYSTKWIEAFHQKIQSFAPSFADFIKQKNSAPEIDPDISRTSKEKPLKEALTNSSHFMSYRSNSSILRFYFPDESLWNGVLRADAEKLAPAYIKALDYFLMLKLHIEKLQPSDFKTSSEKYLNELISEVTLELETLPQRIDVVNNNRQNVKKWDDPNLLAPNGTSEQIKEKTQNWLRVLRGLNVTAGATQVFASMIERLAATDHPIDSNSTQVHVPEACEALFLEHQVEAPLKTSINVDEAELVRKNF